MVFPSLFRQYVAFRADEFAGKIADGSVESLVGQHQAKRNARLLDDLVPAIHAALNLSNVIVAQPLVQSSKRRDLPRDDFIAGDFQHGILGVLQNVIVLDLRFLVTPPALWCNSL